MREIKFRGKNELQNTEWLYGNLEDRDGEPTITRWFKKKSGHLDCDGGSVLPETVGQYTGLKDKNNKEIFEGDVLRVRSIKTDTVCVVVFREGWFIGITEDNGECEFRYMVDVEIIGNIHDNPDLITIKPLEEE